MMNKFFLLLYFISLLPACSDQSLRLNIQQFTLTNGLRILILGRHDSPTFAAQMVYKVGSVNERPGITGAAHLLEHLTFQGTETIGSRDYKQEFPLLKKIDEVGILLSEEKAKGQQADSSKIRHLQEILKTLQTEHRRYVVEDAFKQMYTKNGAIGLNGSTNADYTHYYCTLPSNRLDLWCRLESDRMRNPVLREFYSVRDAVAEERRRTIDNNPTGVLWEALLATAFMAHPYQWPVIGWMSDIQTIRRSEVNEFRRMYYIPNNCAMILVGDIYPDKALQMIKRYFGDIPSQPSPKPVETVEPDQRGERIVKIEYDAEPCVCVGYHKPAIGHSDQYVFDVLEALFAHGKSSRLYRELILEKQVAVRVNAYGGPDKYPGLFILVLFPSFPHTTNEVLAALDAEIARLAVEPISERELKEVKNRLRADFAHRLESNRAIAEQIAFYEGLSSWEYINTLVERHEAVTSADIQRVVRKYFVPSNRTIAKLAPIHEGKG